MTDKVCQEYLQQFPIGSVEVKNEDRINFMLSHPVIRDKLDEWVTLQKPVDEEVGEEVTGRNQLIPQKSEEYSVKKREEGNSYFKRKSFLDSIRCYNEALQFTPLTTTKNENKNAALCFGNRSAAYYELGTPKGGLLVKKALENSLSDTIHCVKYGYPENLKIKISLRQVNIYLKLGDIEKARESFQAACACLAISKEAQLKINHLQTELEKVPLEKAEQQDDAQNSNTKFEEFRENPLFEGASEVLSIYCSKEKTRYVKCNKKVTFGEILFKETPFSSVLLPSYYGTHCFHCHCHLDNNLYFFPCASCSQVKFCSEECFSSAWEIYHKYECGYLDLLHSVGIGHLATRIILTAGVGEILEAMDMERNSAESLQLPTKVFKAGQHLYHRILSLLDHIDVMRVEDLFQYTLTASLLTNFLVKKTCFFDETREEDVSKIGGVLLKHICQLICNAHAITFIATDHEVLNMSTTTTEERQLRIASAIYTSSSLMNHSCEPNIASSFYQGRTLLVKATTDLRKGSEVFNCYGPHARRMNRASRQEILSQQYFFTCDCPACEREQEEEFSFVDKFDALKCKKCNGPIVPDTQKQNFLVECPECAIFTNVEESMHGAIRICRLITKAEQKLDQAQAADALSTLLEAHEMCKKYLYRFNSDFGKVNDMLAKCYSVLGDFDAAIRYLKQSVEYVEERFGESSIEYARELRKLGELIKLHSTSTEEKKKLAEDNIDKANEILKLYF